MVIGTAVLVAPPPVATPPLGTGAAELADGVADALSDALAEPDGLALVLALALALAEPDALGEPLGPMAVPWPGSAMASPAEPASTAPVSIAPAAAAESHRAVAMIAAPLDLLVARGGGHLPEAPRRGGPPGCAGIDGQRPISHHP
jgi:hypothetical protein